MLQGAHRGRRITDRERPADLDQCGAHRRKFAGAARSGGGRRPRPLQSEIRIRFILFTRRCETGHYLRADAAEKFRGFLRAVQPGCRRPARCIPGVVGICWNFRHRKGGRPERMFRNQRVARACIFRISKSHWWIQARSDVGRRHSPALESSFAGQNPRERGGIPIRNRHRRARGSMLERNPKAAARSMNLAAASLSAALTKPNPTGALL